MQLIVNADDFGLTERVNEGIRQAHLEGIVTAASLMATGAAFDQAVALSRELPKLDIGVHLALVDQAPALGAELVPTLVGPDGRFPRHALTLAKRYFAGRIDLAEVRRELEAQLTRVLACGIRVTHLDSHQHAHVLPAIFRVTVELAARHGIQYVRFPAESLRAHMLGVRKVGRTLELLALGALCMASRRLRRPLPHHFAGFYHGGDLTKRNLLTLIDALPDQGVCELMCHPGSDDPESPYGIWGYRWSEETAALTDPDVHERIRSRRIELKSYREVEPEQCN